MSNVISIPQYVLNYNSYLNINLAAHAPCFDRRTCVFCFEKKKIYRLKNLIRLINAWSVSFVDDKTELIQQSPLVPPPLLTLL